MTCETYHKYVHITLGTAIEGGRGLHIGCCEGDAWLLSKVTGGCTWCVGDSAGSPHGVWGRGGWRMGQNVQSTCMAPNAMWGGLGNMQ